MQMIHRLHERLAQAKPSPGQLVEHQQKKRFRIAFKGTRRA